MANPISIKFHSLFFLILISNSITAQVNPTEQTKPIVEEGKRLYRSEMASWYGTDLFLEQYNNKSTIGGYFSYADELIIKCIFFSKEPTPKVIGTISFDSTFNTQTAHSSLEERDFTNTESDLFDIRKKSTGYH